jgi:hypothetical protein
MPWKCPACDRRVPDAVGVCRCGASRSEALAKEAIREIGQAAGPGQVFRGTRRNEPMPGDLKAVLVLTAVALIGGVVFAVLGPRPAPMPALLGWMDTAPHPSPSPSAPPRTRPAKRR